MIKWFLCSIVWWGLAAGAPGPACADGITVEQVIKASDLIEKLKQDTKALAVLNAQKMDVIVYAQDTDGCGTCTLVLCSGGQVCSGGGSRYITTMPAAAAVAAVQAAIDKDMADLKALGVK